MGACASKRTKQRPIKKTTTKKITTNKTTTNETPTNKKKEELSPKEALRASIIYLPSKGKDKAPFISSPSTSPSQPIYIGLDLGTVYSTVSIWKEGKPILVTLQGVPRVLSMVAGDDIHPKVYFGKDAMDLVGIKAQSIVFSLKLSIYRLDDRDDVLIDKFIEFMRARALPHDQNFNSVVTCLPGCFNDHGGVSKIRNMMSCQFNSKVRIISDTAATFLYYLDGRFGNVLSGVPPVEERFVIINFGGGFFSCGETKIKNSRVQVIKEESFQVGGEMLVGHMMGIVSAKAGIMNLNAPGKLWNLCKEQAELIGNSKEITLDLSEFGCENNIIKISLDEIQSSIDRLLENLQGCVIRMVGNGDRTNILLSGGMCFFRPFREWLDHTFAKKVIELNNMTSACALGTAIYAGVLNSNGKDSLQLDDLPQFF